MRRELHQKKADLKLKYPSGVPLKEQLTLLKDSDKLLSLSAVEFGDSRVLKLSYELSQELDTRLSTPGTPVTQNLVKELNLFIASSCSSPFQRR
jgi:hypothetical protein